jgi:hypothetical protein
MKTKLLILGSLMLLFATTQTNAQYQVGVGLGIGTGVGTGQGSSLDVERIGGIVVQGRRVFTARFLVGESNLSPTRLFGFIPRPPRNPDNILPGQSGGMCSASTGGSTRKYSTVVTIFNPNTNAATLTFKAARQGQVGPSVTTTLSSCGMIELGESFIRSNLGLPPGMPFSGAIMVESLAQLDVIATYELSESVGSMVAMRELHEECMCPPPGYEHDCPFTPFETPPVP